MSGVAKAMRAAKASGVPIPQDLLASMGKQADQIWSMLDDMAENDPGAYRKFIESQLDQERRSKEPHLVPKAGFALHTAIKGLAEDEPTRMYANIVVHKALQPPIDAAGKPVSDVEGRDLIAVSPAMAGSGLSIPLALTEPRDFSAADGTKSLVVDVLFHPWVAAKCAMEAYNAFKLNVIELALGWIEKENDLSLSRAWKVTDEEYIDGFDSGSGTTCRTYYPSAEEIEGEKPADADKPKRRKWRKAGEMEEVRVGGSDASGGAGGASAPFAQAGGARGGGEAGAGDGGAAQPSPLASPSNLLGAMRSAEEASPMMREVLLPGVTAPGGASGGPAGDGATLGETPADSARSKPKRRKRKKKKKGAESAGAAAAGAASTAKAPPAPPAMPSRPVIEEVLDTPDLEVKDEPEGHLTLVVGLPGVLSMAGVDLDLSSKRISLTVPDKFQLDAPLPCDVAHADAKAKFSKRKQRLTVVVKKTDTA